MIPVHPLGRNILVIGGDERLRTTIAEILGAEGFAVTAVSCGAAALAALERADFALIVAETRLPGGIDGITAVRRARARRPALKCLFTASLAASPIWDNPDLDDFIAQPFHRRELLGCVFELLQRRLPRRAAPSGGIGERHG